MALTTETLESLPGTSFGPVRFINAEKNLLGEIDGDRALIDMDGGTVRITADVQVDWPKVPDLQQDIDQRIAAALTGLGALRSELVLLYGDAASSRAQAVIWLDSMEGVGELAAGVRTTILLARSARRSIAQVGALVNSERELLARAQESERLVAAATSRLEETSGYPARPERASEGYWFHVEGPVDIRDLDDHERVVGTLQPGSWYLCTKEAGAWVIADDQKGLRGWVPRSEIHPAPR